MANSRENLSRRWHFVKNSVRYSLPGWWWRRVKFNIENDQLGRWWHKVKPYIGWDDYFAVFILFLGILGFVGGPVPNISVLTDIYLNLRAEMIGIGITVLIIANANDVMNTQTEKKRLILQMGSPDNAFAIEAVRQLRVKGWLEDGTLADAYLFDAELCGAKLGEAELSRVNLNKAKLVHAALFDANLNNAKLIHADLGRANLSGAELIHADLRRANLSEANLGEANLGKADLSRANLSGADLSGAKLGGATLIMTDLEGAKYNQYTIWPYGWDREKLNEAGAVFVETQNPRDMATGKKSHN